MKTIKIKGKDVNLDDLFKTSQQLIDARQRLKDTCKKIKDEISQD